MSFVRGISHDNGSCESFECTCKLYPISLSFWTASQFGDLMTVQFRVKKNPTLIFAADEYGYTALHYAAHNGHDHIVSFLLSCGANANANECGATPLHRAGKSYITSLGSSFDIGHHFTAYAGHVKSVELLLKAGADVNAQDSSFGDMNTAAHKAVLSHHIDVLGILTKYSANLHIKNKEGLDVYELSEIAQNESNGVVANMNNTPPCSAIPSQQASNLEMNVSLISCSFCHGESFALVKSKNGKLFCDECIAKRPSLKWCR